VVLVYGSGFRIYLGQHAAGVRELVLGEEHGKHLEDLRDGIDREHQRGDWQRLPYPASSVWLLSSHLAPICQLATAPICWGARRGRYRARPSSHVAKRRDAGALSPTRTLRLPGFDTVLCAGVRGFRGLPRGPLSPSGRLRRSLSPRDSDLLAPSSLPLFAGRSGDVRYQSDPSGLYSSD